MSIGGDQGVERYPPSRVRVGSFRHHGLFTSVHLTMLQTFTKMKQNNRGHNRVRQLRKGRHVVRRTVDISHRCLLWARHGRVGWFAPGAVFVVCCNVLVVFEDTFSRRCTERWTSSQVRSFLAPDRYKIDSESRPSVSWCICFIAA